jgi:hypothetical protein
MVISFLLRPTSLIKFGSQYLLCHTPKTQDWLERHLDPRDVWPVNLDTRTHSLHHLGVADPPPMPAPRVGVLHWPTCAQSFGFIHLLATDDQIGSIRTLKTNTGDYLELSDGTDNQVRPFMYLLPPRPLQYVQGASRFWLCTFVDARWFWWFGDREVNVNYPDPDQSFLASTTPGDVCSGEISTKDVASNLNCPFGPLNSCCEWFVHSIFECCGELSPDPDFTMCLFEDIPNEGESCDAEELFVMVTPPFAFGDQFPKVSAERSREIRSSVRKAAKQADGPGSELKAVLAELGLKESGGCPCESRQAKMNEWGVEGCLANRAEIEGWLRDEASKAGWKARLKAAAKAVTSGIAFHLNPLDPAPGLLDLLWSGGEKNPG